MGRKGSLLRQALVLSPSAPAETVPLSASSAAVSNVTQNVDCALKLPDKVFVALVTVNDAFHLDSSINGRKQTSAIVDDQGINVQGLSPLASRCFCFRTPSLAPVHKGYLVLEPSGGIGGQGLVRVFSSTSCVASLSGDSHEYSPCLLGVPMTDLLQTSRSCDSGNETLERESAKLMFDHLCSSSATLRDVRLPLLNRRWPNEPNLRPGVPIRQDHATHRSAMIIETSATSSSVVFPFCLSIALRFVTSMVNCPVEVVDVDDELVSANNGEGMLKGIDCSEALLVPIQCSGGRGGDVGLVWPQSFLLYSREKPVSFSVSLGEIVRLQDRITVLFGHAVAPKQPMKKVVPAPSIVQPASVVRSEEKVSKLLKFFASTDAPSSDVAEVSPTPLLSPEISGKLLLGGTGGIGSNALVATTITELQEEEEIMAVRRCLVNAAVKEKREREECERLAARRDADRRAALYRYLAERERLGGCIDWNVVRDEFGVTMDDVDSLLS